MEDDEVKTFALPGIVIGFLMGLLIVSSYSLMADLIVSDLDALSTIGVIVGGSTGFAIGLGYPEGQDI